MARVLGLGLQFNGLIERLQAVVESCQAGFHAQQPVFGRRGQVVSGGAGELITDHQAIGLTLVFLGQSFQGAGGGHVAAGLMAFLADGGVTLLLPCCARSGFLPCCGSRIQVFRVDGHPAGRQLGHDEVVALQFAAAFGADPQHGKRFLQRAIADDMEEQAIAAFFQQQSSAWNDR
ncbi:hypothetical protein SDC9_171428 [bioreactor metagenome]|uniref:Uncharacterized protein n=1 Tax=bioreactor metagenome TaxID=1076179 RepID=A0A645GBL6_9ZZZZ